LFFIKFNFYSLFYADSFTAQRLFKHYCNHYSLEIFAIKLSQKTALITGASRGIGRAIALALAQQTNCLNTLVDFICKYLKRIYFANYLLRNRICLGCFYVNSWQTHLKLTTFADLTLKIDKAIVVFDDADRGRKS
jgi:hypothetical protein